MKTRFVPINPVCVHPTDVSLQVWALAVSSDESTIVSGAADSVVTFWQDCTEEQQAEKDSQRAELVQK